MKNYLFVLPFLFLTKIILGQSDVNLSFDVNKELGNSPCYTFVDEHDKNILHMAGINRRQGKINYFQFNLKTKTYSLQERPESVENIQNHNMFFYKEHLFLLDVTTRSDIIRLFTYQREKINETARPIRLIEMAEYENYLTSFLHDGKLNILTVPKKESRLILYQINLNNSVDYEKIDIPFPDAQKLYPYGANIIDYNQLPFFGKFGGINSIYIDDEFLTITAVNETYRRTTLSRVRLEDNKQITRSFAFPVGFDRVNSTYYNNMLYRIVATGRRLYIDVHDVDEVKTQYSYEYKKDAYPFEFQKSSIITQNIYINTNNGKSVVKQLGKSSEFIYPVKTVTGNTIIYVGGGSAPLKFQDPSFSYYEEIKEDEMNFILMETHLNDIEKIKSTTNELSIPKRPTIKKVVRTVNLVEFELRATEVSRYELNGNYYGVFYSQKHKKIFIKNLN